MILLYHCVGYARSDPWSLFVSPRRFAAQMRWLEAHARPMSMEELASALASGAVPSRAVAVTFDDGYANNLHLALPVLERHRIPATLFVSTGRIGTQREAWYDELEALVLSRGRRAHRWPGVAKRVSAAGRRVLGGTSRAGDEYMRSYNRLLLASEDERRGYLATIRNRSALPVGVRESHRPLTTEELALLAGSSVMTIGAHTVTHPVLSALTPQEQGAEIGESKAWLEDILSVKVDHFAYPFGGATDFSDTTAAIVQSLGFKSAVTTSAGTVSSGLDTFRLPRRLVGNWNAHRFARQLDTWFSE